VTGYLFLAFVIIAGSLLWYAKNQGDRSDAEQAAVTVEATYNPTTCGPDRPILVVIRNGSKRTLKSVTFALHAFENGRSEDLAIDSGYLESDVIVPPAQTSNTCGRFRL
jgi:hypothetical protein